jgi:8-oxo-dGTP diphosphatase
MFLREKSRILLIEKKRGLGAGKVNGPGGRIEPGESALEAAVRETREEVGITPLDPVYAGLLRFQFTDGYALECFVFTARTYTGELKETDEAAPFWSEINAIPFERMWSDDSLWFPFLLENRIFEGAFLFDGERMLQQQIVPAASGDSPIR